MRSCGYSWKNLGQIRRLLKNVEEFKSVDVCNIFGSLKNPKNKGLTIMGAVAAEK